MRIDSERELDLMLRSRPFVSPNENLAQRIIMFTKSTKQYGRSITLHWLHGIFVDFFRFQPAYLLTLMLVLGVCLGFITSSVGQESEANHLVSVHALDFFYSVRSSYL
jgi:hypothetical protein